MAYMKDPRENTIDLDVPAIWEADNRVEERWIWNGMIVDYCDMSPEEYMKNPIVEAINNAMSGSPGGGGDCKEVVEAINNASTNIINTINSANTVVVDAINSANTSINDNIVDNTVQIVSAITGLGNIMESSVTVEILFYYASINSQIDYTTLTENDFASSTVVNGSDTYINYILGDPSEENWQKFINGQMTEAELRHLSSNSYYIAIPKAYKNKLVIQENGTADVTDDFTEVEQDIFEDYILYQSIDDDYFNEDYETGARNVKHPHKITIMK